MIRLIDLVGVFLVPIAFVVEVLLVVIVLLTAVFVVEVAVDGGLECAEERLLPPGDADESLPLDVGVLRRTPALSSCRASRASMRRSTANTSLRAWTFRSWRWAAWNAWSSGDISANATPRRH